MQADHVFNAGTDFYAEGFQMLSQYGGTLSMPVNIGGYDDNEHYKMHSAAGI